MCGKLRQDLYKKQQILHQHVFAEKVPIEPLIMLFEAAVTFNQLVTSKVTQGP